MMLMGDQGADGTMKTKSRQNGKLGTGEEATRPASACLPSELRSRSAKRSPAKGSRVGHGPDRKHAPWLANVIPEGFVANAKDYGIGIAIGLITKQGSEGRIQSCKWSRFSRLPGGRHVSEMLERTSPHDVARLISGLAHADRVRILAAVISGADTHKELCQRVGLKTGPLYHHLRVLERGGLIVMHGRNSYRLTEPGRVTIVLASLATMFQDRSIWKSFGLSLKKELPGVGRRQRGKARIRAGRSNSVATVGNLKGIKRRIRLSA